MSGGKVGNRGGTGRPPNALCNSMREILEEGLPHLREFAIGENDISTTDQLRAIELAGRFGLPKEAYDKDLVDELWNATEGALLDHPELIETVKVVWLPVLAQRLMAGG